jgi:hypothetical protein
MDEDLFDSINPVAVPRKKDLYIKRDYIRTLQVIYRWKKFLFIIIVLCLVLLQSSFLFVRYGHVVLSENQNVKSPRNLVGNEKQLVRFIEDNLETESKSRRLTGREIKFEYLSLVINIANTILIFSTVLYCFLMFQALGASLGGGLGGIGHISRACVYSLMILILLLPWQLVFKHTVLGVVYTPQEPVIWCIRNVTGLYDKILLYLRFTGYPIFVFILLLLTQLRCFLWKKNVVHRLEQ